MNGVKKEGIKEERQEKEKKGRDKRILKGKKEDRTKECEVGGELRGMK